MRGTEKTRLIALSLVVGLIVLAACATAESQKLPQVNGPEPQVVIFEGHTGYITCASYSPDGKQVLTASWDGTVRMWPHDGQGDPVVLATRGRLPVKSASFSPDGSRVLTASETSTQIWDLERTRKPIVHEMGYPEEVEQAQFSPDGRSVLTLCRDGKVRIWRPEGPTDWQGSIAFSPDGKWVLAIDNQEPPVIRIWPSERPGRAIILKGHTHRIETAEFSPDCDRIVTCSYSDGAARIWRTDGTGEPIELNLPGIQCARFFSGGEKIMACSFDGTVRSWNRSGANEQTLIKLRRRGFDALALSPDEKCIATTSVFRNEQVYEWLQVWQANGTGRPVLLPGHHGHVTSFTFSPDSKHLLAVSEDLTVRSWRVDTDRSLDAGGPEAIGTIDIRFRGSKERPICLVDGQAMGALPEALDAVRGRIAQLASTTKKHFPVLVGFFDDTPKETREVVIKACVDGKVERIVALEMIRPSARSLTEEVKRRVEEKLDADHEEELVEEDVETPEELARRNAPAAILTGEASRLNPCIMYLLFKMQNEQCVCTLNREMDEFVPDGGRLVLERIKAIRSRYPQSGRWNLEITVHEGVPSRVVGEVAFACIEEGAFSTGLRWTNR
jgi:WD40 repeat protein